MMIDSTKIYRWLTRLYPARFREEYQEPMVRQFRDDLGEAKSAGARASVWLRAIADLLTTAPGHMASELNQDLRYALRVYRRRRALALLAVSALALAIGASTGVFSVLHALLLQGLPFSDPSSLVEISGTPVVAMNGREAFQDWWRRSTYLQAAASFSVSEMNVSGGREAVRARVAETSANFFDVLGTSIRFGRSFTAEEDKPGKGNAAIISNALWQQLYGSNPNALGTTLRINGIELPIVGVAPPRFDYPGRVDVWIPTVFSFQAIPKRGAFLLQTVGRLKSGLSLGQTRQRLLAETQSRAATLVSIRDQIAGPTGRAAWVLAAIVLVVLLAACANLAQMLLSRTTERYPEIALRSALGAGPARLVQQLMTEAIALTVTGAIMGLVIAQWTTTLAVRVLPSPLAAQEYRVLDLPVLLFAIVVAMLTAVAFGVLPASLIARMQPSAHLMRSRGATPSGQRMRAALLGVQAAITLALLVCAFTLGRTFLRLLDSDLGFQTRNVVTATVSLQGTTHRSSKSQWQFYSRALERLQAVPGVQSAGAINYLPLVNNLFMAGTIKIDSGQAVGRVVLNGVTPGYFQASGTTILAGRDFTANDSQGVVIVNQEFANQTGIRESLIGRHLLAPWTDRPYLIAGIVNTVRLAGPAHAGGPQIYWPVQEEPPPALTFVVRVAGDVEPYLTICRDTLRSLDPSVPVYDVKTLDQRLEETLARPRFYVTATLFLAGLAVLLAVIGIYGSLSYALAQRRHEMGVRLALGATPSRVRWLLLGQSLAPVWIGTMLGLYVAGLLGQYLKHLIDVAASPDVSTFSGAALLLLLTAAVAAWRATAALQSLDPMEALRAE